MVREINKVPISQSTFTRLPHAKTKNLIGGMPLEEYCETARSIITNDEGLSQGGIYVMKGLCSESKAWEGFKI